ncbi:hypothetical protein Q3G72_026207 [Acer saccharum]|nr:hypothetical protein Q3G72_026207 [Acer saccharum]
MAPLGAECSTAKIPVLIRQWSCTWQTAYPFEIRVLNSDSRSRYRATISYTRVPDQLERRFTKLISAVDALREDVRKSDLERNESDKVKEKQYKELVRMIQTLQGTSTHMHRMSRFIMRLQWTLLQPLQRLVYRLSRTLQPLQTVHRLNASSIGAQSQQDSAAASDVGPQTQHDTVAATLVVPVNPILQVERPVWLRKCSSQTTTFYTDPCRRKKSKTEANKFCLADPVHRELLEAYL